MINEISRLLEFDKIITRMKKFAHSSVTMNLLENIAPLPSRQEIELRLAQIEEIRSIGTGGTYLPFDFFTDISELIDRVRPKDALLAYLHTDLLYSKDKEEHQSCHDGRID